MKTQPFSLLCLPATKSTRHVVNKFPFPITLTKGTYGDVALTIENGVMNVLHNGVDIRSFSFTWLSSDWDSRDIAYAVRLYAKHANVPHTYTEKSSSKVTDCVTFALNDLPIPDTVFVHRDNIEQNIPLIERVCGYPLIIKDTKGSQGKHSALVRSKSELLKTIQHLPKSKKFLFQRFIPNEYDWGVMVANGTVVSGEKSYPATGEFRNNACNGAQEMFVDVAEIPQTIKDIAIQASSALKLSWSRVDIIVDKTTGAPYLLEVNRYPGITAGSSEVSGAYAFLASHISA